MGAFRGIPADGCGGPEGKGVKAPSGREVGLELMARGLECSDGWGVCGVSTDLEGNPVCVWEKEETGHPAQPGLAQVVELEGWARECGPCPVGSDKSQRDLHKKSEFQTQ